MSERAYRTFVRGCLRQRYDMMRQVREAHFARAWPRRELARDPCLGGPARPSIGGSPPAFHAAKGKYRSTERAGRGAVPGRQSARAACGGEAARCEGLPLGDGRAVDGAEGAARRAQPRRRARALAPGARAQQAQGRRSLRAHGGPQGWAPPRPVRLSVRPCVCHGFCPLQASATGRIPARSRVSARPRRAGRGGAAWCRCNCHCLSI
jgi:hypothetical protein